MKHLVVVKNGETAHTADLPLGVSSWMQPGDAVFYEFADGRWEPCESETVAEERFPSGDGVGMFAQHPAGIKLAGFQGPKELIQNPF